MSAIVFLKIVYSSFIQSLSQKKEWLVHAFNQYALFEFDVQFWIPNCGIIKFYDMVPNRIYLGVYEYMQSRGGQHFSRMYKYARSPIIQANELRVCTMQCMCSYPLII